MAKLSPMQKADWIWMDGELIPWDAAQVHVLSHALHYGSAVFEGIRAYATPQGPAVLELDAHLERLERSCRVVHIPLPFAREVLHNAVLDTVRRNGHPACYIRPLAFRGEGPLGVSPLTSAVHVTVATWEWAGAHHAGAREEGIDVCVSSWRRMAPGTHPAMAKAAGNYLNSQLVLVEAKQNGFHDGIVLDVNGYVSEGSGANLFLELDGRLITPPLGDSILPGITRGLVIQLARELGLELVEQRIAREMLTFASEVFLVGTAAEITPVRSVDRIPVGAGEPGSVTRSLQAAFRRAVTGEDDRGWLTPVGAG